MFTGIVIGYSIVVQIETQGTNKHFTLKSPIASTLHIDQSVAHDGVCLTVVEIDTTSSTYKVTAVEETLSRTTLQYWKLNDKVNIELSIRPHSFMDGHIVQGHVDTVGKVIEIKEQNGSWTYIFEYDKKYMPLVVEKGSIAVNGISLTVVNAVENTFSVAIIPYTYHNTNVHALKVGQCVNLEFDIIGKYVQRYLDIRKSL
ncbi:MAG: riboflavin synthase [Bacteroidia bacterium]|nr:riboflavin synthase [Bacteroidia bacterium]MDW8347847.1 riboflavin synthase [Bacteroidia bacterium]